MKNWLKLNNIFFIPNPEVQKIFDSVLIYNFWHLQCCSCKHQILGIENIFLEIIYHCLEILFTAPPALSNSSPHNEQLSPLISQSLANSSAFLFYQKIVSLKDLIASNRIVVLQHLILIYLAHSGEVLSDFTPVTPAEVSQLLQSMSSKSSPLDYIPISLLKSCRHLPTDTFSILITHLANLSFTQAIFPSKFKLLSELHWLPVCHGINFKIATITFKVLQCQQPSYLAALIPRYVPTRSLRSSSSLSLYVFLIEKPEWHSPDHFHLLPRVFGINSQVIFHLFPSSRFLQIEIQAPYFFECLSR